MTDPNVVVTTRPDEYLRAQQLLGRFGHVETTDYFNVVLLTVPNIERFLDQYQDRAGDDPRLGRAVASVRPMQVTFRYRDVNDFESQAQNVALRLADRLEGKSFHVRMHRRGHRGEMSSQIEERLLDGVILGELERRGRPGRITFDDPDAILDVETVGGLAGMSLWSRDDLERLPFLKTD